MSEPRDNTRNPETDDKPDDLAVDDGMIHSDICATVGSSAPCDCGAQAYANGREDERARIHAVFAERRELLQADIDTRPESDPAYHTLTARKHEVGTLWAIITRRHR